MSPDPRLHRTALRRVQRRGVLRGGLTLGGLSLLGGCNLADDDAVDRLLFAMSRFNDRMQAALFAGRRLAPEYAEKDITEPFPFNAFYTEAEAPVVPKLGYALEVSGRVDDRTPWTLERLRALPQQSQVTRHICVEGWSAIGQWGGVRFSDFLSRIGADTRARYVSLRCADDYYVTIDMPTALQAQTTLALTWRGQELPRKYGYPIKLRIPTKLGFKNPKHVMAIEITDEDRGGYWEDQGYNWFSGL